MGRFGSSLGRTGRPKGRRTGSGAGKTHEAPSILQQIRSKLDAARVLSRSLGTPEEPYELEVTLDTIIMGIEAQIGALENASETHGAQ